jgi:hypothetical protein
MKRVVCEPITWIDARGQVVYVKGSRKNKIERLTAAVLEATKDLLSGTVTRADGKVFYAPFHIANNEHQPSSPQPAPEKFRSLSPESLRLLPVNEWAEVLAQWTEAMRGGRTTMEEDEKIQEEVWLRDLRREIQ